MYELKQSFLKAGHRLRPGGKFPKISITIHSTGNPGSTPQNERDWLDNPTNTRTAAWHYVVGAGTVIQAIPDIERAWHCGEEAGNRFSIGVEIVETGDRRAVLETAAEFVADKVKEYGWTLKDVKKHYDWTKKDCPRILIDHAYIKDNMDWRYFIGRIEDYLKQEDEEMEKRYQTIAELPDWARPVIKKLVAEGKIADGLHLDLTFDMLRLLVIMNR